MKIIKEHNALKHWDRVARYYSLFRFNPISYAILKREQKSIRYLIAMRINNPHKSQYILLNHPLINDKVYSRPATVIIPVLISLSFL